MEEQQVIVAADLLLTSGIRDLRKAEQTEC
jgi:hypothetical protein